MKEHMETSKNLNHGRAIKSWVGNENVSKRVRSGEMEVLLKIFRSDRDLVRFKKRLERSWLKVTNKLVNNSYKSLEW